MSVAQVEVRTSPDLRTATTRRMESLVSLLTPGRSLSNGLIKETLLSLPAADGKELKIIAHRSGVDGFRDINHSLDNLTIDLKDPGEENPNGGSWLHYYYNQPRFHGTGMDSENVEAELRYANWMLDVVDHTIRSQTPEVLMEQMYGYIRHMILYTGATVYHLGDLKDNPTLTWILTPAPGFRNINAGNDKVSGSYELEIGPEDISSKIARQNPDGDIRYKAHFVDNGDGLAQIRFETSSITRGEPFRHIESEPQVFVLDSSGNINIRAVQTAHDMLTILKTTAQARQAKHDHFYSSVKR